MEELQLLGERLEFRKLSGDGPDSGWVSLSIKGKALLRCETWRPGEGLGPWKAHEEKATCVLLDPCKRRLFSAAWSQASVKCWESTKAKAELSAELSTHGLVSQALLLSEEMLVTAISANPMEASVCHQADFKQRMAEADDKLSLGEQLVLWRLAPTDGKDLSNSAKEVKEFVEDEAFTFKQLKQLAFHQRGCQLLAAWPPKAPELMASASRDALVAWKLDGEVLWRADLTAKVCGLCWASAQQLWSCDAHQLVLWDTNGVQEKVVKIQAGDGLVLLGRSLVLLHVNDIMILAIFSGGGERDSPGVLGANVPQKQCWEECEF